MSTLTRLTLPGLTPYAVAHARMLERVEERVRGEVGDAVMFVEHPPVVTRGRGLQLRSGEAPRPLAERQIPIASALPTHVHYQEIERGGDLTLHHPGQIVIYPIVKLDERGRSLEQYLRAFEQAVIDWATHDQGLEQVGRRDGAAGVWVGNRKLASLGVAVRRWVSFHGVAINVTNRLAEFAWISPCGFAPEVMTSLAELGRQPKLDPERDPDWPRLRSQLEDQLWERLTRTL